MHGVTRAEYADQNANEKDRADKELPADVPTVLEKAQENQLISLDPAPPIDPKDKNIPKDKGKFHNWRVLGQTTIKDADARKKVLDAVLKGIQESEARPAASSRATDCTWPTTVRWLTCSFASSACASRSTWTARRRVRS